MKKIDHIDLEIVDVHSASESDKYRMSIVDSQSQLSMYGESMFGDLFEFVLEAIKEAIKNFSLFGNRDDDDDEKLSASAKKAAENAASVAEYFKTIKENQSVVKLNADNAKTKLELDPEIKHYIAFLEASGNLTEEEFKNILKNLTASGINQDTFKHNLLMWALHEGFTDDFKLFHNPNLHENDSYNSRFKENMDRLKIMLDITKYWVLSSIMLIMHRNKEITEKTSDQYSGELYNFMKNLSKLAKAVAEDDSGTIPYSGGNKNNNVNTNNGKNNINNNGNGNKNNGNTTNENNLPNSEKINWENDKMVTEFLNENKDTISKLLNLSKNILQTDYNGLVQTADLLAGIVSSYQHEVESAYTKDQKSLNNNEIKSLIYEAKPVVNYILMASEAMDALNTPIKAVLKTDGTTVRTTLAKPNLKEKEKLYNGKTATKTIQVADNTKQVEKVFNQVLIQQNIFSKHFVNLSRTCEVVSNYVSRLEAYIHDNNLHTLSDKDQISIGINNRLSNDKNMKEAKYKVADALTKKEREQRDTKKKQDTKDNTQAFIDNNSNDNQRVADEYTNAVKDAEYDDYIARKKEKAKQQNNDNKKTQGEMSHLIASRLMSAFAEDEATVNKDKDAEKDAIEDANIKTSRQMRRVADDTNNIASQNVSSGVKETTNLPIAPAQVRKNIEYVFKALLKMISRMKDLSKDVISVNDYNNKKMEELNKIKPISDYKEGKAAMFAGSMVGVLVADDSIVRDAKKLAKYINDEVNILGRKLGTKGVKIDSIYGDNEIDKLSTAWIMLQVFKSKYTITENGVGKNLPSNNRDILIALEKAESSFYIMVNKTRDSDFYEKFADKANSPEMRKKIEKACSNDENTQQKAGEVIKAALNDLHNSFDKQDGGKLGRQIKNEYKYEQYDDDNAE